MDIQITPIETQAREVVNRECAYLDDKKWDEWLDLFDEQCVYWVPTWLTEERLSSDPTREIAHMYYSSRAGLADRIVRIRSRKSPATHPVRRTCHSIGNLIIQSIEDQEINVRTSWHCMVFEPQLKTTSSLFGSAEYVMTTSGDNTLKIKSKKTIVMNDYLPSMVDIYSL